MSTSPGPADLEQLRREHQELRDEFAALLRCLEKRAVLPRAAVWNEKFASVKERHPLGSPAASLVDVLHLPLIDLLRRLCLLCGQEDPDTCALHKLKQASSRCSVLIDTIQGKKIYVFGGQADSGLVVAEALDPRSQTWTPVPAKGFRRGGCVAGALGGRIYVCGGPAPTGTVVDRFNPKTQAWEYRGVPQMKVQRNYAAAAALGGRLYICGGEDTAACAVHATVEYLDLSLANGQGCWVLERALMAMPRRNLAAAVLPHSPHPILLICGGIISSVSEDARVNPADVIKDTVEGLVQGVQRNRWEPLPTLGMPRVCHGAATLRGSVYACGGLHRDYSPSRMVERLDVEAQSWVEVAPMLLGRMRCVAVAAGERLYVLGGQSASGWGSGARGLVECFDPERGEWEPQGNNLQLRVGPAIAVVNLGVRAASLSRPPL